MRGELMKCEFCFKVCLRTGLFILLWDFDRIKVINRGYLGFFFFSVKDRNLFHRVDTIGNIFTSGATTSENITDGGHEMG